MKQAKIAIIVVALSGSALIYFITRSGADPIPDTPESATGWMCQGCEHVFSLTAMAAGEEYRRAGGQPPLFCPACNEKKAYRAATCMTCGTKYLGFGPGRTGACPKCHPDEPDYEPVPKFDDPAGPEPEEPDWSEPQDTTPRKRGPPAL
ncbi:MAG: hypothetical protein O7D94_01890 [Planctomycetota bacterium]|nr:hypothetical protein [Planctomycetota bacterium]